MLDVLFWGLKASHVSLNFLNRGLERSILHILIEQNQGCGSVFIFSGSVSRVWGWRPIRIRIRIQGFNDQKFKKNYSWKFFYIFFLSKTAIYLSLGLHKVQYVQVIEEAFSSQKRPSNTSKHELLQFLSPFVGHFCPPGSGSGSTDPIEYGFNPDPQPWTKLWIRIRIGIQLKCWIRFRNPDPTNCSDVSSF